MEPLNAVIRKLLPGRSLQVEKFIILFTRARPGQYSKMGICFC